MIRIIFITLTICALNVQRSAAQDPTNFPNIGFTPMLTAIDEGQTFEQLEEILKTDPTQISKISLLGVQPIFFGTRKQGLNLLIWMREHGASLRVLDVSAQNLFHHMIFQAAFPEVDADHLINLVPTSFFKLKSWYDETRPLDEKNAVLLKYLLNAGFIEGAFDSPDLQDITPLMIASALGHLELVKYLVNLGANIHAVSRDGHTATTYALEFRHPKTVAYLVSLGAEWDVLNREGEGPYHRLFKHKELDSDLRGISARDELFLFLAKKNVNPNIADSKNGMTALHLVCAAGDLMKVRYLIEHSNADYLALTANNEKLSCLTLAMKSENETLVDYLLTLKGVAGGQLSSTANSFENSPLMAAIKSGDQKTAFKLVEAGVSLEPESSSLSVLNYVASYNRADWIPELVHKGCNINAIKQSGETALSTCLRAGSRESFETLIQMGANPNLMWSPESPPLLLAYEHGYDWAFDALLAHPKIQQWATNFDGQNLVHLMVRNRDIDGLKKFQASLPDPNQTGFLWNIKDREGMTPMHLAVTLQDQELVEFLGERGGSPWTNNRAGLSPRELAAKNGATEILKYLSALEARVAPLTS